jgi:hypothetical protein
MPARVITAAGLVILGLEGYRRLFLGWGLRWGAREDELLTMMPGDDWLTGSGPRTKVVATRAISIAAPPEVVWPWIAQLGRGAGWYSYDRLDNDGTPSAQHIVPWIPQPCLGDASAIGYVRHLEPGREIAWWVPAEPLLGSTTRLVAAYRVSAEGRGSRLVSRYSADATGPLGVLIKHGFLVIDTVMARRQLLGIRERVEAFGTRDRDPGRPESGDRARFQSSPCVYADGSRCGRPGDDAAMTWHERASRDLGSRMGLPASPAR